MTNSTEFAYFNFLAFYEPSILEFCKCPSIREM